MRSGVLGCLVGLGILTGLCGCGSKTPTAAEATKAADSVNLAALDRSRKELNDECDTFLKSIEERTKRKRANEIKYSVLDELPEPVVPPVFQRTRFDAELGISVPAYGKDSKSVKGDEAIAMQYALFGDVQGAELVAPSLKGKLDRYSLGRNIPIEWTRYAALSLFEAMNRTAENKSSLSDLLSRHEQVQAICKDDKIRNSLVGQTLLSLGRRTVQAAASAFGKGKRDADAERLIAQCEQALAKWGEVPPTLSIGGSKQEWIKKLAVEKPSPGRVLVCDPGDRAFDLLNLPFPREDALGILLFFPPRGDTIEEVTIVYSTDLLYTHSKATSLAGILADTVKFTSEEGDEDEKTSLQKWGDNMVCRTRTLTVDRPIGAWVRLQHLPLATAKLPRALGPIKLDWSFDTNRLRIAPQEKIGQGEFVVTNPETLAALAKESHPDGAKVPEGTLAEIALQPAELDRFLLRQVRFRFQGNAKPITLALPFWELLGPSDWRPATVAGGGVEIYWSSGETSLTVFIPGSRQDAEIELTHVSEPIRDTARETARRRSMAIATENDDRQQRMKNGKPWTRLPRKIAVPALGSVTQYELGMPADAAKGLIPKSDQIVMISKQESPSSNVLIVVNAAPNNGGKGPVARQWIMRFQQGKGGEQLTWIRVHYEADEGTPGTWPQDILRPWREAGGVTTLRDYRLAYVLGNDSKRPQYTFWRDDKTEVQFVYDQAGAVEITLAARPDDDPGVMPAANAPAYLWRGPYTTLVLDMSSTDLQKMGLKPNEKKPNEFSMIPGPKDPWDYVQVTTDDQNRVTNIVARYRPEAGKTRPSQKEIQESLMNQWGRQIRLIGWPNRSSRTSDSSNLVNGFTWVDAATRYRLTWTLDRSGTPVLLSEWQGLSSLTQPAAGTTAGASPAVPAPAGSVPR